MREKRSYITTYYITNIFLPILPNHFFAIQFTLFDQYSPSIKLKGK